MKKITKKLKKKKNKIHKFKGMLKEKENEVKALEEVIIYLINSCK